MNTKTLKHDAAHQPMQNNYAHCGGDIVERLRTVDHGEPWLDAFGNETRETANWLRNPDGPEAADLIERLRARLAAVKIAVEKMQCRRCEDTGVDPWSDFGGKEPESCTDCADLRQLLEVIP